MSQLGSRTRSVQAPHLVCNPRPKSHLGAEPASGGFRIATRPIRKRTPRSIATVRVSRSACSYRLRSREASLGLRRLERDSLFRELGIRVGSQGRNTQS